MTHHEQGPAAAPGVRNFTDGLIDGMFIPASKRTRRHWIVSMGIGALVGVAGVLLVEFVVGKQGIKDGIDAIGGLPAFFGLLVVGLMLWIALMVTIAGSSRRALRRVMDLEEGDPDPTAMAGMFRYSALSFLCSAGLVLLVLFNAIPVGIALPVAVLLLVGEHWLAWRVFAMSDELWRRATLESAALQAFLLSLVLSVWAVLQAYALLPALSPMALLVILLGSGVATTIYAVRRRGLMM